MEPDDEHEEVEQEDDVDRIQKLMQRMRAEGSVFRSSEDLPDSSDPQPQGFSMFKSRSTFGR